MKILIFGLGITGISSAKALYKLGYEVDLLDSKYKENDKVKGLEDIEYEIIEENNLDFSKYEYIVKSPGILNTNKVVIEAEKNGLEVLSDIEVSYRIFGGENIIAITGTNGKTTTASLVSYMLNCAGVKNRLVGNIGVGVLWEMYTYGKDYMYVMEVSSFQLSNVKKFKPHISLILNIAPDHLNWHKDYEEYIQAKMNIYKNQDNNDYTILNYEDDILRNIDGLLSKIIYTSTEREVNGIYEINSHIYDGNDLILERSDISIPGKHNVSNALFAIAIGRILDIDIDIIKKALKTFKAVEHRLEYVCDICEMKIYNDSKATNEDSTVKALDSFDEDIILIAGGVDKKVTFEKLFLNRNNIKALILIGENKDIIERYARENNIRNIYKENSLEDAVKKAINLGKEGEVILFSPASASFDMFRSFEDRGKKFKEIINNEKYNGKCKENSN